MRQSGEVEICVRPSTWTPVQSGTATVVSRFTDHINTEAAPHFVHVSPAFIALAVTICIFALIGMFSTGFGIWLWAVFRHGPEDR